MTDLTGDARISAHEQVCAVRYESIDSRIGRLETMAYIATGGIITQLLAAVAWFLTHGVA